MKLLTINICPPDKCADRLKKALADLGFENRAKRIIDLIPSLDKVQHASGTDKTAFQCVIALVGRQPDRVLCILKHCFFSA